MDPLRTAHLNAENVHQIHERLLLYRGHNAKFLEYFPDGTCRELERTDPLAFTLLATTPFPGIQPPQVQQLMNTIRYFLFDLQNSVYELVPHGGPDQTLSNMVFYRQYPEGFGVMIPVQASTGPRYALPVTLRTQLAQTTLEDEPQLQQNFVASGNAYYLDVGILVSALRPLYPYTVMALARLASMPPELQLETYYYLGFSDLLALSHVSRFWRGFVLGDRRWSIWFDMIVDPRTEESARSIISRFQSTNVIPERTIVNLCLSTKCSLCWVDTADIFLPLLE
ncbi:hypothetical protein B0H16DRAFT_1897656, partial [Mycena metata]